ncbi:MAG TPA: UDP-N-acetylmuramate dehydrogenase [Desulfobacteria bacterium]|nr:UDP-N-acetylmuramate dehydrogenase [Desulfobacteria bacterium]
MSQFVQDLEKKLKGSVLAEEPLRKHTTIRIGGPAEVLIIPADQQDVVDAVRIAAEYGKQVTIIGNGSNLLVSDNGIPGLVVKLVGGMTTWKLQGNSLVAESGCLLPALIFHTIDAGFSGLEFAAGIPASLGGALVMNAGANGGEIGSLVEEVQACNAAGEVVHFSQGACRFGYRQSVFQSEQWIILAARINLQAGDKAASLARVKQLLGKRKQIQPLDLPNAGSIFRNPIGGVAGKLIDEAGCKGLKAGGAMISNKHANFIVNVENATAADVLELIERVKTMVMAKHGIELHPEVRMLGFSRG